MVIVVVVMVIVKGFNFLIISNLHHPTVLKSCYLNIVKKIKQQEKVAFFIFLFGIISLLIWIIASKKVFNPPEFIFVVMVIVRQIYMCSLITVVIKCLYVFRSNGDS